MAEVWLIDAASLIDLAQAGLAKYPPVNGVIPPEATEFLDHLVSGTNNKIVINTIIRTEAAGNPNYPDAQLLDAWLTEQINSDRIDLHSLSPADLQRYDVTDGGEWSLIDSTARDPSIVGPGDTVKLVTPDASFFDTEWYRNSGWTLDRITDPVEINGRRIAALGGDAVLEAQTLDMIRHGQASDRSMFNNALKDLDRPGDLFRRIMADESGAVRIGEFPEFHWTDLAPTTRQFIINAAGETVGAAAVVLDAYVTRQAFMDALARGDLATADQLLGGLIGRSFGGAFAAVISGAAAGAVFGNLPGAIFGAILGGVVGAMGGGEIGEWLFGALGEAGVSPAALLSNLAQWLRDFQSDPIVLDLSGDGFDLTALDMSATYFDLDEDGLAERTGWVAASDALLVRDINGNGVVDGIGELIGSAITDGFDVLALLDTNADGEISALDANFGQLKVWRDLNGDGASTSNEIMTLAQAGIVSLSLAYSESGQDVQGNTVARIGSFIRSDGASREMASVWFALDQTVAPPTVPSGADIGDLIWMPRLSGSADVPHLTTAMYHDPLLRQMVEDVVEGVVDFATIDEFMTQAFEPILFRWTGVDAPPPPGQEDHPAYLRAMEALTGQVFHGLNWHQQELLEEVEGIWQAIVKQFAVQFLIQAAQAPRYRALDDLGETLAALDPQSPTYLDDTMAALEDAEVALASAAPVSSLLAMFAALNVDAGTGEMSGDFEQFIQDFTADQPAFVTFAPAGTDTYYILNGGIVSAAWYNWYQSHGEFLFVVGEQMGFGTDYVLNASGWNWALKSAANIEGTSASEVLGEEVSTIGGGLSHEQRLYGYAGNDELIGYDAVDVLVGGKGNDTLRGGSGSDMYVWASDHTLDRIIEESGTDDVIYFSSELRSEDLRVVRPAGTNDLHLHFGSTSKGIILQDQLVGGGAAVEHLHFVGQDGLDAGDIASIYFAMLATGGNDTIQGSWAGETLVGADGNDSLNGLDADDTLRGDAGADTLIGGLGNDRVEGGAGDDSLYGNEGFDTLIGGTGNDLLHASSGDSVYVWALGDGDDTISEGDWWDNDNTIELSGGIAASQLRYAYTNGGAGLRISVDGQVGSVTVDYQLGGYLDENIDEIRFADGLTLTRAEFQAAAIAELTTAASESVWGSDLAETIDGEAGNDTIDARNGDDWIIAGLGDDTILEKHGNDTFYWRTGDGHDTIVGAGNFYEGLNTIEFAAGIAAADLTYAYANGGAGLKVIIAGQGSITILNQLSAAATTHIEQIRFADGTSLTRAQFEAAALEQLSTSASESVWGSNLSETIKGDAGNDTIDPRSGDDRIIGGADDDTIEESYGNDTYVWGIGDGDDSINGGGFWDGYNTIKLREGIDADDLIYAYANGASGLTISVNGQAGSITIADQFDEQTIDELRFFDGSFLTRAQFEAAAHDQLNMVPLAPGGEFTG